MAQRYAAVQSILRAAQPFVKQHGFTRTAICAANPELEPAELQAYFPTQYDAVQQLLGVFDRTGLEEAMKAGHSMETDGAAKTATETTEVVLAGKLLHSEAYGDRLTEALAQITSSGSFLRNLPSPGPVYARAWNVVDEAIYMTSTRTPPPHPADWYTSRIRLANAFMLAELHMLSPEPVGDVHSSLHLFRRLARKNVFLPAQGPDLGAWANWGGRGWLGIFRSLGL